MNYHTKYIKYKNKLEGSGKLQPYIFQKLVFLGTNSGQPTPYRNVSSTCLSFGNGVVWMFDCGEATQHQLLKTKEISTSNIEKIFITHLHGDHLYGLPGLISTISSMKNPANSPDEYSCSTPGSLPNFSENSRFFEFYGPLGLSEYIRTVFKVSHVCLNFKYRVNEIIPNDIKNLRQIPPQFLNRFEEYPNYIYPNENGTYNIISSDKITVQAGKLQHPVFTLGYVITEPILPGSINMNKVKELGIKEGKDIGRLKSGENIMINKKDEQTDTIIQITITPDQVLNPQQLGRKLTILGDTANNEKILPIAMNSDFLVHESTLSGSTDHEIRLAISRGHSTAYMAGYFAAIINAKQLILNHFGSKFNPREKDPSDMNNLLLEAKHGYINAIINLSNEQEDVNTDLINPDIITSEDFYVHDMKRRYRGYG
jgi:ribonuclease Z